MNNNMPWEKLAQYFAGELKGEEYQKMEKWIKSDPVREKKVKQLHTIWKESELPPYQLDVEDAWDRLSAGMDNYEHVHQGKQTYDSETSNVRSSGILHQKYRTDRRHLARSRRFILAAAMILIMASSGLITYYIITSEENAGASAENDSRILVTQFGERATYVLNDRSRVVLHAGSRLEIPNDFNEENRKLYLEGEAYFEVEQDSEKPFIVHSRNSYTRVVGTRFLVQSWEESNYETEVIVSEGIVMFGDIRKLETSNVNETLVTQNQRAVLTDTEELLINEVADMDWYFGWTEGKLIFENRTFREIVPRLERWYNIDIKIEREEIAANRITAEIDYSLPMSDVLTGIAMTLGFELEKENRTITFR